VLIKSNYSPLWGFYSEAIKEAFIIVPKIDGILKVKKMIADHRRSILLQFEVSLPHHIKQTISKRINMQMEFVQHDTPVQQFECSVECKIPITDAKIVSKENDTIFIMVIKFNSEDEDDEVYVL
jgi:hypothetical protein